MIPRRFAILLGTAAFFSALAGPALANDWTMGRCDPGMTGYTEEKLETPLTLSWQYNAARYKNNPSSPAISDGTVYFCSGDHLYAVDAESGVLKWRYPAEEALGGVVKTSVAVAEGLVFFGANDGNLYAIDAKTGKYVWAFSTSGPIKSSPVVMDGIVYFGSDDNNLYAVRVEDGESQWTSGFRTKDDVANAPAVGQGLVVFVSKDTNMYAANATTGKTRWYTRLPMSLTSTSPVVSDGAVYVAVGSMLQMHTLGSGELRGTIRLHAEAAASPAVADKSIYVACRDKKLYAYEHVGKSLRTKWAQGIDLNAQCAAPPTVAGDLVIVPCAQGVISAFSAEDGTLKWRYVVTPSKVGPATDFTDAASSVVVAGGAMYVLTDDGALHCFTPGAADDTGPEMFNFAPMVGSAMNGSPPLDIAATIVDSGSGLDESSVQLMLDGDVKEHTYDLLKSQVSFQTPITQPVRALRDGPHDIELTAKDWKGNKLDAKWSFIVDNTMRPRVIPKKATGSKAKTEPKKRPSMRPNYPNGRNGPSQPPAMPPPPPMPGGPGQPGAPPGPGPYRRHMHYAPNGAGPDVENQAPEAVMPPPPPPGPAE